MEYAQNLKLNFATVFGKKSLLYSLFLRSQDTILMASCAKTLT